MTTLGLAPLTLNASPAGAIDAAAQAGFSAVGIRICARRPGEPFSGTPILGNPLAARALRSRAADSGVRLSNVLAYQLHPGVTWDQVAPVIDSTHELGIGTIVVNGFDSDQARFTALLARYCDAAATAKISIALEFMPFSGVRSLDTALAILEEIGAANAGVLLDSLHLDRSGLLPTAIASIPRARIAFAQICDAKRLSGVLSDAELLQEARWARLPAGEGELPLFDFLDALPPNLEVEYEVPRSDLFDSSPLDKARAAFSDATRFMNAYTAYRARGHAGAAPAA